MIYRFSGFDLDTDKVELRANGEPLAVEPQVFALLALLIEHRERLVSKDEVIEKVWEGRVVSESALSSRVKSARKLLGDDGATQRFIKTIHRQGFRFVAEVQPVRTSLVMQRVQGTVDTVAPALSAVSRPSIAVLPFRFRGGATASQAAFADALPDDLISQLSRLRWLFVTARGSSFRIRDADTDMAHVGQILGVRYCLAGTVEIAGSRLIVATQLIDTRDGGIVWADELNGAIDDVHQIRSDICSSVLSALEIRIPLHEAALARLTVTENLDAWSAYHLGLQHIYRFNRADNAAAAALFGRAISQDPGFARAHAGASFVHFQTAFMHYSSDVGSEIALARSFAGRALELDPLDPFVNFTMGRTYWLDGDLESSLAWLDRAITMSPNFAQGIYARAWTESMAGRGTAGREHVDHAMRLSPIDPLYYAMLATRAFSHIVLGEDREAVDWAERGARSPGAHVLIAQIAVATHALAGNDEQATAWAANVRSRNPSLTRADFFRAFPVKPAVTKARLSQALQRFGF